MPAFVSSPHMRHLAAIAVIAAAALSTGCRTAPCHRGKGHSKVHTTPLEISGPVNVSGPVTVTGPVSVSGVTSGASSATTQAPDSTVVRGAPVTTSSSTSGATAAASDGGDVRLELKTEDLTVDRRTVSNGAARIRKYVVTEERSIPVTLRREEYVVERVPASGAPTTPFGEASATIDLPLTVETAVGVVTPRVTEVIRVRKTVETDTKDIKATLRTEKFEVIKAQ